MTQGWACYDLGVAAGVGAAALGKSPLSHSSLSLLDVLGGLQLMHQLLAGAVGACKSQD